MAYERLQLGFSPLTERIYLGKVNLKKKNEWSGDKKDVTSNFVSVMLQKFEPETETTLTVNGKKRYTVTVRDLAKKKP